jgi:transcriptional regulator GlxA family with amidase domain
MLPQKLLTRLCRARSSLTQIGADIGLTALARTAGMSRSQFILRYRNAFGETPHQTRIRARLARARLLLGTTDISVTDICMEVGFSSLGTFSRTFSARCGESPSRDRARVGRAANAAARVEPHCITLLAAAWSQPSYF